VTGGRGHSNL